MQAALISILLKVLYYLVDKGWDELKEYLEEKKKLEEEKKALLKKFKEVLNEKLPDDITKREQARLRAQRLRDATARM